MTIHIFFKKAAAAIALMTFCAFPASAQFDISNAHLKVDWQMNSPIGNSFADRISGWGMNYELTYDISRN